MKIENNLKVNSNVRYIFDELKKLTINNQFLFSTKAPIDDYHYTKTFGKFQAMVLKLYEGNFLTEYKIDLLEDWFKTKYKYYLRKNEISEKIQSCRGSWKNTNSLLQIVAENYASWFSLNSEVQDTSVLTRSISDWFYNPFNKTSMFYICVLEKSTSLREATAEKTFDSILPKYRKILSVLNTNDLDGFSFWNKAKQIIDWYKKYAIDLMEHDTNAQYWLNGGCATFLKNYVEWLLELTDRNVFLSHLGVGNQTWALYCTQKKKEHSIKCTIPHNLKVKESV